MSNYKNMGVKMERTLVLVKPDGVEKKVIGAVIDRFERSGLRIVALKMLVAGKGQVGRHYVLERKWYENAWSNTKNAYDKKGIKMKETPLQFGKRIRNALIEGLMEGPIVAMVVEGNDAIAKVRKIAGATSPDRAEKGTIRNMYSKDSYEKADKENRAVRNIIHASDGKTATREIKVWFTSKEIHG